jgi:uncharacterized membrane protein YczE
VRAETAARWRPSPPAFARLLVGLALFGLGEGLVTAARLGNSPWTVLSEGFAVQTGTSIGTASIVTSLIVLAAWIPLRQAPGLGTVLNAILIGVGIDVTLALVGRQHAHAHQAAALVAGILLVAIGSGFYLGAYLGPGPRDGLMTALHRRTGVRIAGIRTALEVSAAVGGAALGGRLGVGTVAYAVLIGPGVARALRLLRTHDLTRL